MMTRKRMSVLGSRCIGVWFMLSLLMAGCGEEKPKQTEKQKKASESTVSKPAVVAPNFNADSAYDFVDKQVAFGPRVPNSQSHIMCGDYLVEEFNRFGWKVTEQVFDAVTFDGTVLKSRNIVASFNPSSKKRILLAAHWDTRPFADQEEENRKVPIDGANDGASGVGVLMEVARAISTSGTSPNVGVDIMLFDSEDYGAPDWAETDYSKTYYCLGSQHWAKQKHEKGYHAYYGILLDMVGAKGARFTMEGHSMQFAPKVVKKVWDVANANSYGEYFVYEKTDAIIDDHYFVNTEAGIPMIDIIHYDRVNGDPFFQHWHKHGDTMESIDRKVLKAVGQTLLHVLYAE